MAGKCEELISEFRQLLRKNPNDIPIKRDFAVILDHCGMLNDAKNLFEECMPFYSSDKVFLLNYANLLYRQGGWDESIKVLQLVIDPNSYDSKDADVVSMAHNTIGLIYKNIGDIDNAIAHFKMS